MKQHVTQQFWDIELNDNEKKAFTNSVASFNPKYYGGCLMSEGPNIGQMIEFLGDGWEDKIKEKSNEFNVSFTGKGKGETGIVNILEQLFPSNEKLCDSLWEAIKYKLRNETNS